MSNTADEAVAIAQQEVEYRVELFNKMVSTCYGKCVDTTKFKDGQLTVGENSCIDRCSSKYWQVVAMIGTMLSGK